MNSDTWNRRLALLALVLTLVVSVASAYIRLTQAQMGCALGTGMPLVHAGAAPGVAATPRCAESDRPASITAARAVHRLSASVVGLIVVLLAWRAWRGAATLGRQAASVTLLVMLGLSVLGPYTPSPLPLVTLANVGGGLLLIACLAWLWRRACEPEASGGGYAGIALLALTLVLAAAGTMIGVRAAIGGCPVADCAPRADIDWRAFDPRFIAATVDRESARALHGLHRLLALLTAVPIALVAIRRLEESPRDLMLSALCLALLAVQIALGVAVTLGAQPALAASAHNLVAGCLIASLAALLAGRRDLVNG